MVLLENANSRKQTNFINISQIYSLNEFSDKKKTHDYESDDDDDQPENGPIEAGFFQLKKKRIF